MSEPEKIKEKPQIQQQKEQPKESSTPKTQQSAFDKVMEQQKVLQQSPLMQGKIADQGGTDQKIKEITKWQEHGDDRKNRDDKDEGQGKDRIKQKDKGSVTLTREAVARGGEKSQMGGGSGGGKGRDTGGFGGNSAKRQIVEKKLADIRGLIANLGQNSFQGKLAQAKAAALTLKPEQMQALVNQIVQSIKVGKNGLGESELRLILREHVFSGLRLRFTSKHGKVSIQFETADRRVRDLFMAESGKIQAALEGKGVAVSEIKIV